MIREWHYLLHQHAIEFVDQLPAGKRRKIRDALRSLAAFPAREPDAEICIPNDRTYQVIDVDRCEIVYWLDGRVCEVVVVRIGKSTR